MQNQAGQIADEILVMDAQRGRREAFDMLVSRWQKRLWWHALNLTGHAETAWDITQESWLDIVRGLTRLNDPAKFGSWAYRIVSHKACDRRSRDGRDDSPAIEPEDTPAETAGRGKQETARDVYDILRRLSARAQVVLNLYYLEGFSLAEIAGILGTPEGTVKSRLHAARIEFREHWESHGSRLLAAIPASGKETKSLQCAPEVEEHYAPLLGLSLRRQSSLIGYRPFHLTQVMAAGRGCAALSGL